MIKVCDKAILEPLPIIYKDCIDTGIFPDSYKIHTFFFFFSLWVFSHEHSRITALQRMGEGISLTRRYHLHPLHGRLDISRAIAAESSPLHIASSRTRTRNNSE